MTGLKMEKDDGVTVKGKIAGWEMQEEDKRLDLILTNREIKVTKTENEIVIKCKEEPSNIVLLVNQMIMPYQYEDGACVYHIERDWIGDTSKAVLYRFSDLPLTHIEL